VIDSLIGHAAGKWSEWFPGEQVPELHAGILASGSNHSQRALVFLLPQGFGRPLVVLKVELGPEEIDALEVEFRLLGEVRPLVPERIRGSVPEPLGLWHVGDAAIMAQRAIEGRRLLVPYLPAFGSPPARRILRRFASRALDWSGELARATEEPEWADEGQLVERVEEFAAAAMVPGPARREVLAFGRALSRARIRWKPGWQHGDIGFGNALLYRGAVRFVDWEHARSRSEPWFDASYMPAGLAGLARRQGGLQSLTAGVTSTLGERQWVATVIRRELEKVWDFPLPLPWAVTLTAMWKAIRVRGEGRPGWTEWRDLAVSLVADGEMRANVGWLAPKW
jgi:hypothetical protein